MSGNSPQDDRVSWQDVALTALLAAFVAYLAHLTIGVL